MSAVKVTKENFEDEVLNSKVPVLLDFWASWCGPCKAVSPIIDEVSKEVTSSAKVCKINVDEEDELASLFKIRSVPTLIVMNKGKVVAQSMGVKSKKSIIEMLAM